MEVLTPIKTVELFPAIHTELIGLLRALDEEDWARPTLARSWRVRDVVAHLLDGDLRKLAGGRDRHQITLGIAASFTDIVDRINELNAGGVSYAARLSPRIMTDLLEITGRWISEYVASLSPHASARIAVAWAGEDRSENWMDIGREYTERWHHQMQIREAVRADGLLQRRWFYPVLDLSVRAFPRVYESVSADVGTVVVFEVDAEGDNVWSVIREASGWSVVRGCPSSVAACMRADADTAWKLFYNALSVEEARGRVTIIGDSRLTEPMLRARSVMV
jgi:mycothiol maleylpyruvate isomerase-like protein